MDYLLESHKELYKHIASFAPGSSQKVKDIKDLKRKFKTKSFDLVPGDCLIHHSQVVHGSKKNISKTSRRGFTIINSSSAKVNKKFRNTKNLYQNK